MSSRGADSCKPLTERRVRYLPYELLDQVCVMLNRKGTRQNYRSLAGVLSCSWEEVMKFDQCPNPAAAVLETWWTSKNDATLLDLVQLLQQVGRYDIIEEIKDPKYWVHYNQSAAICPPRLPAPMEDSLGNLPSDSSSSRIGYTSSDSRRSSESSTIYFFKTPRLRSGKSPSESSDISSTSELEHVRDTSLSVGESSDPDFKGNSEKHGNLDEASYRGLKSRVKFWNDPVSKNVYSEVPALPVSLDSHRLSAARSERREIKSVQPVSCKVALLIGNQRYVQPLARNGLQFSHNDAWDFANALRGLGFDVLSLADLTAEEMRLAMLNFARLAGPGALCVFYYAGIGFHSNGVHYLMPVDARKEKIETCLSTQEMLTEMQLRCSLLNLLILDTCPAKAKKSNKNKCIELSAQYTSRNSIVAFSSIRKRTVPDFEMRDGENGAYMTSLLRHIRSNRRIEDILLEVHAEVSKSAIASHGQYLVYSDKAVRLTSPIDYAIHRLLFPETGTAKLWKPQMAPSRLFFRTLSGILLDVTVSWIFGNVLQLDVYMSNQTSGVVEKIVLDILVHAPMVKVARPFLNTLSLDAVSDHACRFIIYNMQWLNEEFPVVLTAKLRLPSGKGEALEMKVDIGRYQASKIFRTFREVLLSQVIA